MSTDQSGQETLSYQDKIDKNQELSYQTLSYEHNSNCLSGSAETVENLSQINLKLAQKKIVEELFNDENLYYYEYYKTYKHLIYEKLFEKKYQLVKKRKSYEKFCEYFDGYLLCDSGDKQEYNFKIYFDKPHKDFEKEIEVMKTFEDPRNVVKIVDSIQTEYFHILVLEKYQYTLAEELVQFTQKEEIFSYDKLIKIIFDSLLGLIELKMNNILHLHIKPNNIFKSKQGNYCYADFETSHNTKKHKKINVQYYTKDYVFPELTKDYKSIDYSQMYILWEKFYYKQSIILKNSNKIIYKINN